MSVGVIHVKLVLLHIFLYFLMDTIRLMTMTEDYKTVIWGIDSMSYFT